MNLQKRAKKVFSLSYFEQETFPEYVGKQDLNPPTEEQKILRMVLSTDGQTLKIPTFIDWTGPFIESCLKYQNTHVKSNNRFIYITIRHGMVTHKTDDVWHLDGFSMRLRNRPEQNYIWCSTLGTEYCPISVKIPKDFNPLKHNINSFLENFIIPKKIQTVPEKTIFAFDPTLLHRRPPQAQNIKRTFLRLSFVPIEINDIHNTQNPNLPRNYTKDGRLFRETHLTDYSFKKG